MCYLSSLALFSGSAKNEFLEFRYVPLPEQFNTGEAALIADERGYKTSWLSLQCRASCGKPGMGVTMIDR
jgi:hypothetical protein